MFKENATNPQLVATAAADFPKNPELQMRACTLFMLMAKGDLEFAQKIVDELNGAVSTIDAIKAFPDDAALQGMAFEATWQIALQHGTRDTLTMADIVTLACKAMRKHKFDRLVQEFACRTLW